MNQAKHFIETVPSLEKSLPPLIDIEFYGEFNESNTDTDTIISNLRDMIDELERYYGVKPIIYSTEISYHLYIKNNFNDYPQWCRSVYEKLKYMESSEWTFWQYSNRKKLKGYIGEEKYIDMNCFNGSIEEFEQFYQN